MHLHPFPPPLNLCRQTLPQPPPTRRPNLRVGAWLHPCSHHPPHHLNFHWGVVTVAPLPTLPPTTLTNPPSSTPSTPKSLRMPLKSWHTCGVAAAVPVQASGAVLWVHPFLASPACPTFPPHSHPYSPTPTHSSMACTCLEGKGWKVVVVVVCHPLAPPPLHPSPHPPPPLPLPPRPNCLVGLFPMAPCQMWTTRLLAAFS